LTPKRKTVMRFAMSHAALWAAAVAVVAVRAALAVGVVLAVVAVLAVDSTDNNEPRRTNRERPSSGVDTTVPAQPE
jgi:hypothetical protein